MPSRDESRSATEYSTFRARPDVMQVSTIAPAVVHENTEERVLWQTRETIRLQGLEHDMYHHFVTEVSAWIDVFDPLQHFATLVPRLALHNEGLMKAILAVGARHLAAQTREDRCEHVVFKHAAVQYYSETLQYLQTTMQYSSYKNSAELLATTVIISTYEMIDGSKNGWERHLKGMFWIQRTREINGESGGLEQAVWWAWIHQDLWAAFRERRRCYSFFKVTKPYSALSCGDVAVRIVYILAKCVDFCSDEDKRRAEREPAQRTARAEELALMLREWNTNKGVAFDPLPIPESSTRPFPPIWIHPPAFAISVQMYHVASILLTSDRPKSGAQHEDVERNRIIAESIAIVAGIAMRTPKSPPRALSTQCLFATGLFCTDEARRQGILDIIGESAVDCAWPDGGALQQELKERWASDSTT